MSMASTAVRFEITCSRCGRKYPFEKDVGPGTVKIVAPCANVTCGTLNTRKLRPADHAYLKQRGARA